MSSFNSYLSFYDLIKLQAPSKQLFCFCVNQYSFTKTHPLIDARPLIGLHAVDNLVLLKHPRLLLQEFTLVVGGFLSQSLQKQKTRRVFLRCEASHLLSIRIKNYSIPLHYCDQNS